MLQLHVTVINAKSSITISVAKKMIVVLSITINDSNLTIAKVTIIDIILNYMISYSICCTTINHVKAAMEI